MTRTSFYKSGLVMALVVLGALWMASCNKSTPTTPQTDSQTFTSSTDQSHNHTVTLNKSEVETPPASGINRTTSSSMGHSHTLIMSQADLQAVKDGNNVNVTTSVSTSHTHTFAITKWY